MRKTTFLILTILLLSPFVLAEPIQQYNQIYLDPYYTVSFSSGTTQQFNVTVNPPDGITRVINAVIKFHAYILPTVTYTATVNNKTCNTATYTVSTTQAGAGMADVSFDCSNIINQTGNYAILLSANKNTGATTSWLELTYMNKPAGEVKVMGTEYQTGDLGKMFLQFLDTNNNAVSNSECFLTLWYPNDTLVTGFNNTLMSKLNNASEGIYYKNINIPNVTGVYPASAKCYLPATFNNILNNSFAYDGFESGNFTGGTGGWATCPAGSGANCTNGWDVEDTVPLATVVTNATAGCYRGNYCAKFTGGYGFIERGLQFPDGTSQVNLSYAFKFKGFQNNEYFQFYIFDGNWHILNNIGKLAQYGGYTNEVWYVLNITLSDSQFELGNILIGWYVTNQMPSTSDEVWIDVVNISTLSANITLSNATAYQILRGSGEIHVSNYASQLASQITNLNSNLTIDLLNFNNQILNLTQQQYQNLTNQILDLSNLLNSTTQEGTMFVGGTEYPYGTPTGRIVARVLDNAGNPVLGATCNLTIFYPSFPTNSTAFTSNLMQGGGNVSGGGMGVYYYDFDHSGQLGVHTYAIDCTKTGNRYFSLGAYNVYDNGLSNLTAQISNLLNNTQLQYANITTQLDQIQNQNLNITNQIQALNSLTLYLNQTTSQNLATLQQINNTINIQFNLTNTKIDDALSSLTNQITNLNTTITNQITTSTQQVINTLLSMNTTLTNQINSINTTLSAQLTNLLDQIYAQTNLTTAQYVNLTNQISNLQNNIASCCTNLSTQLNNLNFNLSQLQITANILLAGQNQINQTTNQIINDLQTLNQTMMTQFGITNQLIIDTYTNITNQINLLNLTIFSQYTDINQILTNLTNITTTNQNWLQQIWAYLSGYLNTTITNINFNILQINQTLNNLTQTTPSNYTAVPITIIANTTDCITTSTWQIQALVLNQYNQPMTSLQTSCNITTTLWNETTMTYTTPYFTYQNTCPTPMDWNWTIQCI